MQAIAKMAAGPGVEIVDVPEPSPGPGEVKIRLEAASVCGTDLHIFEWDPWAAGRVRPPRIIGHEFCGTVVALGEGVTDRAVGDFVASESHVVAADSPWMRAGLGHVDPDTRILGVDVDGGFAEFAVLPALSARPVDRAKVPPRHACFLDALGNAVHTAADGPVEGRDLLVTGAGPIGLFAVTVLKAMGAASVTVTEVSPFRQEIARAVGADRVLDPTRGETSGLTDAFDGTLEMSGHPSSLALAVEATRPGGRVSMLGVYRESPLGVDLNRVIFKGLRLQGIVGRRLWETWDTMMPLVESGALRLDPVVTHEMPYTEFASAMALLREGRAGKVVFTF